MKRFGSGREVFGDVNGEVKVLRRVVVLLGDTEMIGEGGETGYVWCLCGGGHSCQHPAHGEPLVEVCRREGDKADTLYSHRS